MKLRTRSASCQMSSYCCCVIGMTICLAPRGTCVEGVFRSRSTCRVFGRASILASPSLERSRMTKMPPAGYPAFLQYLQSGRVSRFQPLHRPGKGRGCVLIPLGGSVACLQHVTHLASPRSHPEFSRAFTWCTDEHGTRFDSSRPLLRG